MPGDLEVNDYVRGIKIPKREQAVVNQRRPTLDDYKCSSRPNLYL